MSDSQVRFIRKNGRIIPIRSGAAKAKPAPKGYWRPQGVGERIERGVKGGAMFWGKFNAGLGGVVGGVAGVAAGFSAGAAKGGKYAALRGVAGALGAGAVGAAAGAVGGGVAGAMQGAVWGGALNGLFGSRRRWEWSGGNKPRIKSKRGR